MVLFRISFQEFNIFSSGNPSKNFEELREIPTRICSGISPKILAEILLEIPLEIWPSIQKTFHWCPNLYLHGLLQKFPLDLFWKNFYRNLHQFHQQNLTTFFLEFVKLFQELLYKFLVILQIPEQVNIIFLRISQTFFHRSLRKPSDICKKIIPFRDALIRSPRDSLGNSSRGSFQRLTDSKGLIL